MGNHAAGFFARQDLFGRPYGGVKENNIQKVKKQLEELKEIEEEFYEEHEELDYMISIKEIEDATKNVKMQDINKQIDVISKYYKKGSDAE